MIIPAVIPTSRHHLDVTLESLSTFSEHVQVDVVDGSFAPVASWPYKEETDIRDTLGALTFDSMEVGLDLMIQSPEDTLELWRETHAARIIVHVESTNKLATILSHASHHSYKLGLAFNNDTNLDLLSDIDRYGVDFVQLMGIATIGEQGLPFDDRVVERIKTVKEKFPDMIVSIDGGVKEETLPLLRDAGADWFVSGSAILRAENPEAAYHTLSNLAVANI